MNIETHQAPGPFAPYDQVFHPYIEAGLRKGYDPAEVVAALDTVNDGTAYEQLQVGDHTVDSWRYTTLPILDPTGQGRRPRPPKGGIEAGPGVSGLKIKRKAVKMATKGLLIPVAADDELYFAGAKGGVGADEQTLGTEAYEEVFAVHAIAHRYDPWEAGGVGAPDKRTGNREMDIVVRTFRDRGDAIPEARVTGASEAFGGKPKFRNPATGRGGGIILGRKLREDAKHDPLMRDIMQSGGILGGVIAQGWGNAGRPFGETLRYTAPNTGLKAVIEYQWAVRAKKPKDGPRGFVNPFEVTQLVQDGYLTNKEGETPTLPRGSNLELVSAEEAWAERAIAVVPAAGEGLINEKIAGLWEGYGYHPLIELQIANIPTTTDGEKVAKEKEVFTIGSDLGSAGGLTASGHGWAETMHVYGQYSPTEVGWDPEGYERTWEQRLSSTAGQIFKLAHEQGLTPNEVMNDIIVERAVANLRRHQQLASA